jgi:hypothetical protein
MDFHMCLVKCTLNPIFFQTEVIQSECSVPWNFVCYAVPHNNRYTLLLGNISLYFVLQQVFFLCSLFSLSLSFSPFILCLAPCLLFWTWLSITMFYKVCIQSNQQLALSRLMHSIHCRSAIFPYQALGRRLAQETSIGCAGRHNKKFEGIEHWPCISYIYDVGPKVQALSYDLYHKLIFRNLIRINLSVKNV